MSDTSWLTAGACISACNLYRYELTRWWGRGPTMGFVMLNPSTADSDVDDPTIRRCVKFAKREGCGGLIVVNLFAFRATDPAELMTCVDPCGPEADHRFLDAVQQVDGPLVAAWGSNKAIHLNNDRAAYIAAMMGSNLMCLGKTKEGHPRHPLYVKSDAPLMPFQKI